MRTIEVGKIFDENMPQFNGARLELFGDGLGLFISIPNCREEIIQDVNKGAIKIALTIKNGLMFFLFKIDSMAWSDAPFTIKYYENLDIDNFDYNKISVFLIDANNGILKAMCTIMPNNKFAEELKKEFIRELDDKDFDNLEYTMKLQDIYNKYSPKDLLEFSVVKSKCGSVSVETMICN